MFENVPEQAEAKALLESALAEGPAHAYLFHGPPGIGKRALAVAFAAELLGEHDRVGRGAHPDLYVLEPLGDQIRIDAIRGILPDVTFLLLVNVEEAVKRSSGARDRIEREGDAFMTLVDNGYRQLAGLFPQRVVTLTGDRPVHDIAKEVLEHVRERAGTG